MGIGGASGNGSSESCKSKFRTSSAIDPPYPESDAGAAVADLSNCLRAALFELSAGYVDCDITITVSTMS